MTTETNLEINSREQAIALIRTLAAAGNAQSYIAEALNRARVPTLSGKRGASWHAPGVARLAKAAGIVIAYRSH